MSKTFAAHVLTPPSLMESGASTPRHQSNKRGASKRKKTLLSLLDALNELTNDDETFPKDSTLEPSFQDDRDVPTVDEHLQTIGAESFAKFERNMINFDKQLRNFSHSSRQLGSSVGILSSAYRLRERITQVLYLFHENAADLFPRKVHHQDMSAQVNNPSSRARRRSKPPPNIRTPMVTADLEPEDFPEQIALFSDDVTTFLDCLNEFPEFTDEVVNASILVFQGDLKYWASCLRQYSGHFKNPAVQRYLHDLSSDIGEHIASITSALSLFIEVGVPTIRFAQSHAAENLLNLSTIATFFSSVTATSLQFSYGSTNTPASNAVNAFWFTSLVFSIAAAVNSLLGLTWKQAMYRSPRHLVPWWVSMWIKRSPLMFLVLSVACFSAGLVAFAYSSSQHPVTSTITTVFSAFSSFGLAAVSAWFASERIVFNRHRGRKWLADILDDVSASSYKWMKETAPEKSKTALTWSARAVRRVSVPLRRMSALFGRDSVSAGITASVESIPPPYGSPTIPPDAVIITPRPDLAPPTKSVVHFQHIHEERASAETSERPPDPSPDESPTTSPPPSGLSPEASALARARFRHLARSAVMVNRLIGLGDQAKAKASAPPIDDKPSDRKPVEAAARPRSSRVAGLVPKLQNMAPTQDIAAHAALVRHMEFSPDGKFLATSSWDRTSVIFHVGDQLTSHQMLLHPTGFVGQVAWSPTGNLIMTKLPRAVKIWTQDGVCRKTIERKRPVQSIKWMPHGEAFLSVEESSIVRLDINGTLLDTYILERMLLHDVAVTSDCQRMFIVGTMNKSPDDLQPSRSRSEKQIIVFNLDRNEIENRVPLLHEVRDITVSQNNQFVLVSYENKAPPQLWKVELVKKQTVPMNASTETVVRLSLRHTYMPKTTVDFAGPSYFGGRDDQLIVCAGKAGDIHIWDRESAALLHHVRAQIVGGDLTCLAWNPAADPFMFATGSHDGALRIWTTVERSSQPSPYIYPEFTFQSEGGGGVTPRTRSPSIFPPENDNRFVSTSTEGGLKAQELRASLDELGARLGAGGRP